MIISSFSIYFRDKKRAYLYERSKVIWPHIVVQYETAGNPISVVGKWLNVCSDDSREVQSSYRFQSAPTVPLWETFLSDRLSQRMLIKARPSNLMLTRT